ncbi:MAG: prephenate dehydrogenase/arogenate dehydrogenase family protein [Akkermansia sp.]|jgi:prephenate dehydrogenase|nr:prephenate dehydrogenase/arogenate dehydrogenase family protein [Akkermansia sp.]
MPAPFRTVTIYGPGLLGGSVALAVRDNLPDCELRLWARREQPLQLAQTLGITHTYTDAKEAARGADLIIFATPIGAFEELARLILPCIDRKSLVTDVGSVKAYVHRTTGEMLTERGRMFIGSHPMAGAETQGLENATPSLLQGATVAITNPHGVPAEMEERLAAFWQALGGRTYSMQPRNHDRAVARISHMPHIMAALAARNALPGDVPMADLQRLASSGFRDTTRVCSGAASMWADILWENDVAVREVLTNCVNDLHRLIFLLEDQDKAGVLRWLTAAKDIREEILQKDGEND